MRKARGAATQSYQHSTTQCRNNLPHRRLRRKQPCRQRTAPGRHAFSRTDFVREFHRQTLQRIHRMIRAHTPDTFPLYQLARSLPGLMLAGFVGRVSVCCWGFSPLQPRRAPCGCYPPPINNVGQSPTYLPAYRKETCRVCCEFCGVYHFPAASR